MTRSEYTQHADPAVRRRAAMRQTAFPVGVFPQHMAIGTIDGEEVMLAFTSDGLYTVRDGVATKHEGRSGQCIPYRRITDRDYRPLLIALVGVATALALWWTL